MKKYFIIVFVNLLLLSCNMQFSYASDDVLNFIPAILSAQNNNVDIGIGTVRTATGKIWMDKNLGATRIAISMLDKESFGDLYQWGRLKDGHEKRYSNTINATSYSDNPGHGYFITPQMYTDWRNPHNKNLWQGVSGINNPCPSGFRLPTAKEFSDEIKTWRSYNPEGAFASPLKLVLAGYRLTTGVLNTDYPPTNAVGNRGCYWTSSTTHNPYSDYLSLSTEHAAIGYIGSRAEGCSVRCIKN